MGKLSSLARRAIANTLLVVVSVLSGYVMIEYALYRVMLPVTPLDIHSSLPAVADVLTQTSKTHYLPKDYIALLGDSYAEGYGDWLLQAQGKRNGPFHSAHVIQQQTGRDVVSFGIGGAGSAEAMVLRPSDVFPSSTCSVYPTIDYPRQMVVYFYEGNDLEDNVKLAGRINARYGGTDPQAIDRYLDEQYAASSLLRCHTQSAMTTFKEIEFLSQYYITGYVVNYCGTPVPSRNHIVVGDRTIETPSLQGAAPGLSEESMRLGMDVFAHSLAWLRKRFAGIPITMVYVPSPLTIYRHAGDDVSYCSFFKSGLAPRTLSDQHHDLMRDRVAKISAEQHVGFVDATPVLRDAARTSVIHGPHDWDHLNRIGYEALGTLVATHLQDPSEDRSRTTSLETTSRSAAVFGRDRSMPAAMDEHQTR